MAAITPYRQFPSNVRARSFIVKGVNSITASATFTRAANVGRTNVVNKADGLTITLPASKGQGDVIRVLIGTTITSNTVVVKVANSTDVMRGGVINNDIGDSSAATADYAPTASTSDTFTFTASIGGGKAGDWIELEDYALGFWAIKGAQQGITDPTSPFSAGV